MMHHAHVVTVAIAALVLATGCGSVKIVPLDCAERLAVDGPGPEDVELDLDGPDGPRLIVSVQERRVRDRNGAFRYHGHILDMPLAGPPFGTVRPFALVGRPADIPFHPHGLFLLRRVDPPLLFVVNHAGARNHRVEVFAVEGHQLRWRFATPSSDDVQSPNDVVAVSEREIYVTNLTRHPTGFLQAVELVFGLRSGTVVRFKDEEWRVEPSAIAYANGIAISSAGDVVFVAGTRDRGIHVFTRNTDTGALTENPARFISIGKGVDNLSWEKQDEILVAARHPEPFRFLRHRASPDVQSPVEIWRVNVKTNTFTQLFGDGGRQISAASVGVVSDGWLYIGQVFNEGVVRCRVPVQP